MQFDQYTVSEQFYNLLDYQNANLPSVFEVLSLRKYIVSTYMYAVLFKICFVQLRN